MKYYLAIDIGASSGRHIVGWRTDHGIQTKEIYRFPNGTTAQNGHLTWDIDGLLAHIKAGIALAKIEFPQIASLSIDTWGCDYVLMNGSREILPCYAYRDARTKQIVPRVHEKMPFAQLYRHTGCQFQIFNTVYQLWEDMEQGRLEHATDFLMLPEYLMYKLTGVKRKEYTNATTTGLVSAETGNFDMEIIRNLGLPEKLFPKLHHPHSMVGEYQNIPVVLCATHDTASAVEGIPMEENEPYISSGTWSLLGVKTTKPLTDEASERANYSNEGGVGYNRYQKNIMGMWLVNRLKDELCPNQSFGMIIAEAEASTFDETINANAPAFLAPVSMKSAFDSALQTPPKGIGDYFRCAYRSLAISYRDALAELERNTGTSYNTLWIVGGGAKNDFLNRMTERITGKKVIAIPIEATALGNLKIQMEVGL